MARIAAFAALTVLLLLLLASAGQAAPEQESVRAAQQRRQQAVVRYARRISASMAALVGDTTASDPQTTPDEVMNANRESEEQAVLQRQRSYLGLREGSWGGSAGWASRARTAVSSAAASFGTTAASVLQLAQVGMGGELSPEAERRLSRASISADPQLSVRPRGTSGRRLQRASANIYRADAAAAASSSSLAGGISIDAIDSSNYVCTDGYTAATVGSLWLCEDGSILDVYTYAAHQNLLSSTCAQVTGEVYCICSLDFVAYTSDGLTTCEPRPLKVEPMLAGSLLCRDELSASVGLASTYPGEYCITTTRTGTLSFTVTWHYGLLSDSEIAAMKPSTDTLAYADFPGNTTVFVILANSMTGIYDNLCRDTTLFEYVVPPSNTSAFSITSRHPAIEGAEAFSAIFSFTDPSVMDPFFRSEKFSTAGVVETYLGGANSTTTHDVTYDLSQVPDSCVEGNQMYIETGAGGDGVYLSYGVSRIHVNFSDLAVPPERYKYPKQFNVLYIFLIALIGAIVLGAALAALWYYCQRQSDPQDDLVAKAQRNRTRKEELERGIEEKGKRRSGGK